MNKVNGWLKLMVEISVHIPTVFKVDNVIHMTYTIKTFNIQLPYNKLKS